MNMLLQVHYSMLFFQSLLQPSNEARILILNSKALNIVLISFDCPHIPLSLPKLIFVVLQQVFSIL